MQINDTNVRSALARIVDKFCPQSASREDLLQEAAIHLWRIQECRPKQTSSWYLQSCYFHLANHLMAGRSVDSPKRHASRRALPDEDNPLSSVGDDERRLLEKLTTDGVVASVCAREMMWLLSQHLSLLDRTILDCLAMGLRSREIADRLRLSHTCVVKHRLKIAWVALKLGIEPPSGKPRKETRL